MIEIQETSWYSDRLGREMPVKRYGTKGKPCLVIPSQDGKHNDFESFGMVEACRPSKMEDFSCSAWTLLMQRPGPAPGKIPETGSSCMRNGCNICSAKYFPL